MKFVTCFVFAAAVIAYTSAGNDTDCSFACPDVEELVVDENGVEYSNECYMRLAKCESKNNGPTPAPSESAGELGYDCPDVCPDVWKPVVDENGVEYSNECYMRKTKCEFENVLYAV